MKSTWILVANNVNARIFTAQTPASALEELSDFSHAGSRFHDRDLTTDLPGKIKGEGGIGGHAFEQPTDPKKHESRVFAQELANYLDAAHNSDQFTRLLVVAEPSFLGLLREELSEQVKKLVCFELDKNLVTLTAQEIRNHLPEYLPG